MKRYYLLIILSSLIALLSCEKINYMYYLEKDSNMTFDLNYDVEPYIKALFPYTDKDGHQYISFQMVSKIRLFFMIYRQKKWPSK